MIEQLISRVFYARNLAHYEHWRTKSYAQHKALGKFYDEIIEALDALVEAYQGLNGLIGSIPSPTDTKGDSAAPLTRATPNRSRSKSARLLRVSDGDEHA